MLIRLFKTAIFAGLLAGCVGWALQMTLTVPLIGVAEVYENAASSHDHDHDQKAGQIAGQETGQEAGAATDTEASGHHHDADAWEPKAGFERNAFTFLASILLGVGFSAMLSAAFLIVGEDRVGWRRGLVWGLLAYAAIYVLPSLGLPPEPPGMMAAPLTDRQLWWFGTAVASVAGLLALIKGNNWPIRILGIGFIVAPHIIGAPSLETYSEGPPAGLVAEFVVASLACVGLFWMALGSAVGWFWDRFDES